MASPSDSATPTQPRLVCTVRPWAQFPLERALRGIRTAGYDAVALPVHGVREVITPDTPPAQAQQIGSLIAAHGLELTVLSHAADLDRGPEVALTALQRQIDHCARLGVSTLVDMSCNEPDLYDSYRQLMTAAAPYAAEHGVTIAIKPHGGLTRTAADLLSLIEHVDHDAVQACWDPGNLVHYGGEPPSRGLSELAPHIVAVGARDHPTRGSDRANTTGGMPPAITPGDGIVDFTGLYDVLREHGFTGPSAVESVTKLGTVDGIDSEAERARTNLLDAAAGKKPAHSAHDNAPMSRPACSQVAHAAGQDPIGTARHFDRYLMLELPLPWPRGMGTPVWEVPHVSPPLRSSLRAATRSSEEHGYTMKTFAAAPDPEYSSPGLMRIVRFEQDRERATTLTRREYHIPDELAPELIDALFADTPGALDTFAQYQETRSRRDLVVCTHAAVDGCCGTFGYPLYNALRREHGSTPDLRVWRVSSFGGHRFAPTLIDFPEGRYWGNITPERMGQLVHRSGTPTDLMDCYRGWAALHNPGHQTLERELFRTHGWDWIDHQMRLQESTETDQAGYTKITVTTHNPRSNTTRHYDALLGHTSNEPILVGCDGTASELPRYTAAVTTATDTPATHSDNKPPQHAPT